MNKGLKKQEQKMLDWLEEQNLVRVIRHIPVPELNEKGVCMSTVCLLFDKEEYKASKDKKELSPSVAGHSYCSRKDQFNKQLGRVIATGRAIKKFKFMQLDECLKSPTKAQCCHGKGKQTLLDPEKNMLHTRECVSAEIEYLKQHFGSVLWDKHPSGLTYGERIEQLKGLLEQE